jgi:hypothetical protein
MISQEKNDAGCKTPTGYTGTATLWRRKQRKRPQRMLVKIVFYAGF